jgi:hypothetical protein
LEDELLADDHLAFVAVGEQGVSAEEGMPGAGLLQVVALEDCYLLLRFGGTHF